MKGNKLSPGLISLENLFDCEDAKNGKQIFNVDGRDYKELDCHSGRKLKVGREVPLKDKKRLKDLCFKYDRVITWTYDDLKGYNLGIIQHTIDFVEGSNPV